MKLIKPYTEILTPVDTVEVYKTIEKVARTCYKSEDKITDTSAERMVKSLIKSGHEAMIEFFDITVKFTCDRITSQSIVRHRLGSFAQESTRFCNYAKDKFGQELVFIIPSWLELQEGDYTDGDGCPLRHGWTVQNVNDSHCWIYAMLEAEDRYLSLIERKKSAEQARMVLPMSVKTEINVKFNLREWRHFLNLRCHHTAHPDIRVLSLELLDKFYKLLPVVFEDLYIKYNGTDKDN